MDPVRNELEDMARAEGTTAASLLAECGHDLDALWPLSKELTLSNREWLPSDHAKLQTHIKLLEEEGTDLKRMMRAFLEMAFYSRRSTLAFLYAARAIACHLKMDWPAMIHAYLSHRNPEEQVTFDKIEASGGRISFQQFFDFTMYDSPYGVYTGKAATNLIGSRPG